jgi:hypothetical protein
MISDSQPVRAVRQLPRHRAGSTRSVRVGGTKAYLTSSVDHGQIGQPEQHPIIMALAYPALPVEGAV